ncbi:MAG: Re/Si-specific NAD(P)(+) transhydrogenase subunit alpha [Rhodobacteraceae bacterium]|nr:Re/Si-specific NAD(P)(+) transhydrogenase subunit alpha [Paracoccaceae bacterium]
MRVGTVKEITDGEARVAITPDSAKRIIKLGYDVAIETGAGKVAGFDDFQYEEAGVSVLSSADDLWDTSEIIVKVNPPSTGEVEDLGEGKAVISFVYPQERQELLDLCASRKLSMLAMDMVPRISRAQKMDALSSMANIAGYRSVIEAGNNFGRFFTGQVTAAGKVPPAQVLVIGAGVAGLSAIGTATSLGAMVKAFDVRPEVAEQIESMGAQFLFLDFEEDASGSGGYAKPSSPEFREKQLELFRKVAPEIDIVITTALIPGVGAPKLWLADMVEAMKPGSVIVDLAAEKGGNCDLTKPGEKIVADNKVTIIGYTDFPSRMATQSSLLYATNIFHLLSDLTPEKNGMPFINMEDDVIRGATVAHGGEITYPPPPPKIQAIAVQPKIATKELTPEEKRHEELVKFKADTKRQISFLIAGGIVTALLGLVAPVSFMQHFVVFVLSCFVGYQVIWNVSHSLHTPLMSVTNAISGIIIIGAILQIGTLNTTILVLSGISLLIATINIVGGFYVTRRMLAMFQRS